MESEEKIIAALQQVRDELDKLRGLIEAREKKNRQQWIRSIVVWVVAGILALLFFNAFQPQVPRHPSVPETKSGNSN
jgi:hypothetical protein